MKNLPWYAKLVLALTAFLPLYFMIAAIGSKIGLWSWQVGLGSMTFTAGPILVGIAAIAALIALILGLINWSGRKAEKQDGVKRPRNKAVIVSAVLGLLVPGAFVVFGMSASSTAESNPIYDVSTDTGNPPTFSAEVMAERAETESNQVNDYQVPLSELEAFQSLKNDDGAQSLIIQNHAQIINDIYAELSPLPLAGASKADAVAAVAAAMGSMGFVDIRQDADAGRVEGVAETFWYGFKDDVVARIGENEIDFRSVSRVGRSDLGANAARIAELRGKVAAQIGQR
ncbi:DUF1499 domain-containing protein [uncultured Erythrobacter sp.]|uniref:DUF1499 domain-containing protein n=1 Tax=uncultured Erythrobacter sp. TaxID=263913 RepID=UPI00261D957D|nr:DUF1499 domain-containing protein [uncultured Erythrobacter sp.]